MVKIYGIVEQANLTLMLSPPGADSRIKENHSDLLKIVRKIKGVDVGLGTCRDFAQIPGNRHFAKPLIYQDLEKRLQPQNHIIYLDNEDVFVDICSLTDSMKTREMSPLERFRKKNKRDYLFNIQRSMTMLIKMSELNVHAAFIGQDNLREYIFNPDLLQKYGHEVLVEVPVNFKEAEKAVKEISLSFHRSTNHSKQEFNRLKKTIPPLKYELFRPEKIPKAWASMIRTDMANMTLIQRYKSIINNYTVESSEKQPDYIGSWSMQSWRVPAEGFFELFITEQQGSDVKGIIKDAYGDATFTGTLVENPLNKWHGFKFKKIYDKKAHKDTRGQILLYDGAGSDDWFIGHYVLETKKPLAQIEGAGPPGEFFEMEKYRPGKSQIIINAEDGKEMERELIRQNKSPL